MHCSKLKELHFNISAIACTYAKSVNVNKVRVVEDLLASDLWTGCIFFACLSFFGADRRLIASHFRFILDVQTTVFRRFQINQVNLQTTFCRRLQSQTNVMKSNGAANEIYLFSRQLTSHCHSVLQSCLMMQICRDLSIMFDTDMRRKSEEAKTLYFSCTEF